MKFLLDKLPKKIETKDLIVGFVIFIICSSIIATIVINAVFGYTIKPSITSKKMVFNNLTFNLVETGYGTHEVLCLHGFGEGNIAFSNFVHHINMEYKLTIPDQRGYNLTDKPPAVDDYHIDNLIKDIDSFVDYILYKSNTKSVVLLGHGFGGFLSIIYSHRFPLKVRGLIMINSPHVSYNRLNSSQM